MAEATELMQQLAELRAELDVRRMDYEAKRAAIAATVQDQLDDLEAEYQDAVTPAQNKANELEEQVKKAIIGLGTSVKFAGLHAVYTAPRVTWNTDALDGYATAHPEIGQFRKVGAPSVRIQAAK